MIDLTPLDVRNKRGDFKKIMRGYDPPEVDIFLEIVADRLEVLVRENLQLRERTQTLQTQVEAQAGREQAVQNALVTAQELRADMQAQAQREADHIIKEAEIEARQLLSEADAEVRNRLRGIERRLDQGQDQLRDLERRRDRFLKEFRGLLQRELDVVSVEEGRTPLEARTIDLDLGSNRGHEAPGAEAASIAEVAEAAARVAGIAGLADAVTPDHADDAPGQVGVEPEAPPHADVESAVMEAPHTAVEDAVMEDAVVEDVTTVDGATPAPPAVEDVDAPPTPDVDPPGIVGPSGVGEDVAGAGPATGSPLSQVPFEQGAFDRLPEAVTPVEDLSPVSPAVPQEEARPRMDAPPTDVATHAATAPVPSTESDEVPAAVSPPPMPAVPNPVEVREPESSRPTAPPPDVDPEPSTLELELMAGAERAGGRGSSVERERFPDVPDLETVLAEAGVEEVRPPTDEPIKPPPVARAPGDNLIFFDREADDRKR